MNKDLHNNITQQKALSNTTISADGTTTGDTIDTQGFGSLEFLFQTGANSLNAGTMTVQIFEGSLANMSDEALVAVGDLLGTAPVIPAGAGGANGVYKLGVKKGKKRYMRAKVVTAGVGSGSAVIGAQVLKGTPSNLPVA